MLSVTLLNVVILSVVAPKHPLTADILKHRILLKSIIFYFLLLGGIGETLDLSASEPMEIFQLMLKYYQKGSFLGCGINSSSGGEECSGGQPNFR
jgi:hypothetical protein